MQDWEWEIADPERLDEFIAAYGLLEVADDERLLLMEIILQSFHESSADLERDLRWRTVLDWLDRNIAIHAKTVWYWSCGDDPLEECWRVTPSLRALRNNHQNLEHRAQKWEPVLRVKMRYNKEIERQGPNKIKSSSL